MRINPKIDSNLSFKSNKILQANSSQKYFYMPPTVPDSHEFSTEPKNPKNSGLLVLAGVAALTGAAFLLINRKKAAAPSEVKALLPPEFMKVFENDINKFSSDIGYRQDLLGAIGLNKQDYLLLRPIVGPAEYKSVLSDLSSSAVHFSPGKTLITQAKDGFDLSGVENKTFRATFHAHTNHSDGTLSVQEFLDQAAKYADEVALKIQGDNNALAPTAPFSVAITDHDTLEGCKEAVQIISKNPEKYKNLRVVLGCELSVENKTISKELNSPISNHLLLHSINPYDEALNKLLNEKKLIRAGLIKEIISKSAEKMKPLLPDSASKLSYEEGQNFHPILKNAVTNVYSATKDYVQFRTIFTECFEKNKSLQAELAQKGANLEKIDYLLPQRKYFESINEDFGLNYWKKYEKALVQYVSDSLSISFEEASKKIVVTNDMKKLFGEVNEIAYNEKPKLELQPAYIDMADAINLMKGQKYGYMGIAHPALTPMVLFLKNADDSFSAMEDMFNKFKGLGADRALFAEIHYHYFGDLAAEKSEAWLNSIKGYAKKAGLYSSGGVDSHGLSIFYSQK